jgi:hypothetical protein
MKTDETERFDGKEMVCELRAMTGMKVDQMPTETRDRCGGARSALSVARREPSLLLLAAGRTVYIYLDTSSAHIVHGSYSESRTIVQDDERAVTIERKRTRVSRLARNFDHVNLSGAETSRT